jgi:hypothetical protein
MRPNSEWVTACGGLTLTALLVVAAYALVDQHPIHHLESLALIVNSGAPPVCQNSTCLDRSRAVELARNPSHPDCSRSDCGTASAPAVEQAQSATDAFHRSRLQ